MIFCVFRTFAARLHFFRNRSVVRLRKTGAGLVMYRIGRPDDLLRRLPSDKSHTNPRIPLLPVSTLPTTTKSCES